MPIILFIYLIDIRFTTNLAGEQFPLVEVRRNMNVISKGHLRMRHSVLRSITQKMFLHFL